LNGERPLSASVLPEWNPNLFPFLEQPSMHRENCSPGGNALGVSNGIFVDEDEMPALPAHNHSDFGPLTPLVETKMMISRHTGAKLGPVTEAK
jgi:hypothetical protein